MSASDFHGHKTAVYENQFFRLECLATAGPRIVRLIPAWTGENLFAEVPDVTVHTGTGQFHPYGGHRLWHAPESLSYSYVPDDDGLTIKQYEDGMLLKGPIDPVTRLRKTISIQMSASHPFIVLKHLIENNGWAPVRLSPWALTMMRPGGTAILPQQSGNVDGEEVLPNRRFALWPYSRWEDPRLKLGDNFIVVRSSSSTQPFKIGYFDPHGWLGYFYDDTLFVKRFGVRRNEDYPDYGSNAEVYTNNRFTEIESIGPLVELQPKREIVHTETWEVYRENEIPNDLLGGRKLKDILG
jgi:hypothetical protein